MTKNFLLTCIGIAFSVTNAIITFLPENQYLSCKPQVLDSISDGNWILLCRVGMLGTILMLCCIIGLLFRCFWWKRKIQGKDYTIIVQYGDLFKSKNCKKIVSFDQCFTDEVGEKPWQIKPDSICGQYLTRISEDGKALNIQKLIEDRGLKPMRGKSCFKKKDCYKSGSLVPDGNGYLLLAFAKLTDEGLAEITYQEYKECLDYLWQEIDRYYGSQSVCVPILGAGRTRFGANKPTQQQLLDIMIESYKLSQFKLRNKYKLYIICKKSADLSLNKIGQTL